MLIKDVIAEYIHQAGRLPLQGVMEEVIKSDKVQIYVRVGCYSVGGVSEADLQGKNAFFTNTAEFTKPAFESRVVNH